MAAAYLEVSADYLEVLSAYFRNTRCVGVSKNLNEEDCSGEIYPRTAEIDNFEGSR